MELGLVLKSSGRDSCDEDSRLSAKQWIAGNILIRVEPHGYEINVDPNAKERRLFVADVEPYLSVRAGSWNDGIAMTVESFSAEAFAATLDEARAYAAAMHAAIKEHIQELATIHGVHNVPI